MPRPKKDDKALSKALSSLSDLSDHEIVQLLSAINREQAHRSNGKNFSTEQC